MSNKHKSYRANFKTPVSAIMSYSVAKAPLVDLPLFAARNEYYSHHLQEPLKATVNFIFFV